MPVYSAEQGRWRLTAATLAPAELAPPALRTRLPPAVGRPTPARDEYDGDQAAVWEEIARLRRRLRAAAPTGVLADIVRSRAADLAGYERALPMPPGACGLAVAVAGRVVALDLFGTPALARAYWPRLIRGAALAALTARGADVPAPPRHVAALLDGAARAAVTTAPALDRGRAAGLAVAGLHGTALLDDDHAVHVAVFPDQLVHARRRPAPAAF